jgi:hypothetical protein
MICIQSFRKSMRAESLKIIFIAYTPLYAYWKYLQNNIKFNNL